MPPAAMVRLHPYQDLYFNALAGPGLPAVKQRYELDYWGLSCRAALEHIVAHDPGAPISVQAATIPGWANSLILPPADRARLLFVTDPAQARYFLGHYRWHPGDYGSGREVFSVTVDGAKIATVLLTPAGERER